LTLIEYHFKCTWKRTKTQHCCDHCFLHCHNTLIDEAFVYCTLIALSNSYLLFHIKINKQQLPLKFSRCGVGLEPWTSQWFHEGPRLYSSELQWHEMDRVLSDKLGFESILSLSEPTHGACTIKLLRLYFCSTVVS
jgi:hypothetical protein